jgi:trimeric autotransporter adhesin
MIVSVQSRIAPLLMLGLSVAAGPLQAAVISVTNANDSGAGSLRAAIVAANVASTADTIEFALPGTGPFTINLISALPVITQPLVIDGYSQAGARLNSLALSEGDDAVIQVRLDGLSVGSTTDGLFVCSNNVTIRGLSITRFQQRGITIGDNSGTNCAITPDTIAITGNFIGLAPDGNTAAGQRFSGVFVSRASNVLIGGATNATRNLISGNGTFGPGSSTDGVNVANASSSAITINGNFIGTDASGSLDRGNTRSGVRRSNVMTTNDNLGIDLIASGLNPDGVTPNDPDDGDTGANNLQNFPVINAITRISGGVHVNATLDRPPGAVLKAYAIDVFASDHCDSSGNGEGERFLGSVPFISLNGTFQLIDVDLITSTELPVGTQITLTATDQGTGDTSEFSACEPLDNVAPLVVTSALDTGGASCGATCTLRQALNVANATPGGDTITFNVPGSGVVLIQPTSPLPTITEALLIDGYTQPGATPNSSASADNAVIKVQISGSNAGTIVNGLGICSSDVTLRGLSVTGYGRQGIAFGSTTAAAGCATTPNPGPFGGAVVVGNFIGVTPIGAAGGNGFTGVLMASADGRIGGLIAADRNVISNNGTVGLNISTSSTIAVDGNLIGTGPDASSNQGNGTAGIQVANGDATPVRIGAGLPNLIRFNSRGIIVDSTTTNVDFSANDISDNVNLGIDLAASGVTPDGVTANDPNDADSGANNLQNFPVLVSALQIGPLLRISGSLDVPVGTPSQAHRYAVYASANCDGSGNGEGATYLGTVARSTTNATESFSIDFTATAPAGSAITSTATFAGNTSEFSNCVPLVDDTVFRNGFD